ETSKRAATSVLGIPISIMTWACSTSIGPNFGCWTYLPFALAIAMPSAWRSLIRRRSNSANAARIPSINESKGEAPLLSTVIFSFTNSTAAPYQSARQPDYKDPEYRDQDGPLTQSAQYRRRGCNRSSQPRI